MTIDKDKLRVLAEATHGWQNLSASWRQDEDEDGDNFDWEVGATDESGNRYPVLTINTAQYDQEFDAEKLAAYYAAANPVTVLALLGEIERISARLCMCRDCQGQGEVFSGRSTYEGHNQPPEPIMDVCGTCGGDGVLGPVQDFEAIAAEREQLKAEVAQLKNQEIELRGENEALRTALGDCATSLEGEMLQKFAGQKPEDMHPVTRREYDRDMAELAGYRATAEVEAEMQWCACGDGYPANSYGAGFMAANNGVCENCDAASGGVEPALDTPDELAELRRDAERYRWLRDAENEVALMFGGHAWEDMSSEYMNQSIDAAMAKEQGHV